MRPADDNDNEAWTSQEVADAYGLTYRQLDHWVRNGYIHPIGEATPGTGRTRFFAPGERFVIRVAAPLVQQGMQPETAINLARSLVAGGIVRMGDLTMRLEVVTA